MYETLNIHDNINLTSNLTGTAGKENLINENLWKCFLGYNKWQHLEKSNELNLKFIFFSIFL